MKFAPFDMQRTDAVRAAVIAPRRGPLGVLGPLALHLAAFVALAELSTTTGAEDVVATKTNNPAPMTSQAQATSESPRGTSAQGTNTPTRSEVARPRPNVDQVAANTNTPGPLDFASFKLIADRNIFSPTRTARSAGGGGAQRQAKVDSFSLVGVLRSDKGAFAFFDGSSSDFRKVLKADDSIAGYKVKEIATDHVEIEAGGKQTELRVGTQMRRQDEGDWQVASQLETYTAPTNASSSSEDSDSGTGDASDLIKRLREKREKEMSR